MTIKIPKVWQALLAIQEIPEDAPKARDTKLDDPSPYRDDCREVSSNNAIAKLCSGQGNYWLEWEILFNGVWHHFDEVDHEVTEGPNEFFIDGESVVIGVVIGS